MAGNTCPQCRAELPADAPEGLCPACLLRAGLGSAPGSTAPYGANFRPPAPEELAPHFPQLDILHFVGQGGMGAVYKARQVRLDRPVALKVLPPEVGKDPTFAERFLREARTLGRLSHPHIVTVHDFGESGGYYFFLMEYVEGVNLRDALRAGKFKPEQALKVVPQICDALQYAHDKGVVHRDIKPENVLLNEQGNVKIADFGLAKLLGREAAVPSLTGTRQVLGTPHYMAPEQMERPQVVDHRADIFSLGVLFYEMLTGELPLGRFPPPSQKVSIDLRLDDVVLRTLEKEPERRYQKASEVRTDVETIASSPRVPAPQPQTRSAGEDGWLVAVYLACTFALMASFMPWVRINSSMEGNAWKSTFKIIGLDFPNWLPAMAAVTIAILETARRRGIRAPAAIVAALAVYGIIHPGLAILWSHTGYGMEPQLSYFLTLGSFVTILASQLPRSGEPAPDSGLSDIARLRARDRLRWAARALMFCGVLSVLVLWGFISLGIVLTYEARGTVIPVASNWVTLLAAIGGCCGLMTIRGAIHMARQDRFGPAVTGIWSALFCLPPLSWMAAIWAAWALNRPGARGLFRSEMAPPGVRSA
jgi:serine/threonine protein kinase